MKAKEPKRMDRAVQQTTWMPLPDALKVANDVEGFSITRSGFIKWVNRYDGLGRKIGGRWQVNKPKLEVILTGGDLPDKEEATL